MILALLFAARGHRKDSAFAPLTRYKIQIRFSVRFTWCAFRS